MALASFPTSPDPTKELMGRNLMVHVRDNILVRIKRTALAAAGTLPAKLQAAAMLIRGSTPGGKFHLQVTASADIGFDPDRLLFSMIPDIDQIDALLAMETNDTISLWFRGVSESKGDTTTPVPAAGVSYINLSPFETDEFGVPRAFVHIEQSKDLALANAMDAAVTKLVNTLDPMPRLSVRTGTRRVPPTTRRALSGWGTIPTPRSPTPTAGSTTLPTPTASINRSSRPSGRSTRRSLG